MFDVFHAHTIDCTLKTPYRSPRTALGKRLRALGARLAVCSAQCTLSCRESACVCHRPPPASQIAFEYRTCLPALWAVHCSQACAALRWCLMQPAAARRVVSFGHHRPLVSSSLSHSNLSSCSCPACLILPLLLTCMYMRAILLLLHSTPSRLPRPLHTLRSRSHD